MNMYVRVCVCERDMCRLGSGRMDPYNIRQVRRVAAILCRPMDSNCAPWPTAAAVGVGGSLRSWLCYVWEAILEFGLLWMNITRTGNLLTFASV